MQRTISMLVADDSHLIQQILTEAGRASKLPLRVSATDNGRDCLTLLNGGNIDLAFIDVQMPELNGTDAFWAARKQGIQTFVTLMSNPPSTEAVEMARKLRAYEFLFKPFKAEDAVAIMKTFDRITSPTKVLIVDELADRAPDRAEGRQRQHVQLRHRRGRRRRDRAGALQLHAVRRGLPRLQHARPLAASTP